MADKPDPNLTTSAFLAAFFGAGSVAPVFVCSLTNEKGDGPERRYVGRDRISIDSFAAKWDRDGRGTFFCVSSLVPDASPSKPNGSPRCKENVAELVCCHADTDLKNVAVDRGAIVAALMALELPPSLIVWSGRGVHSYWLFNEPLSADRDSIVRIEAMNARLSDVVGGDPVQDVTRLMRLPGSRNTKDGGSRACEVVHARLSPRYEIGDVEEWLDRAGPVIFRKEVEKAGEGNAVPDNPWIAVASMLGFKPPIDVEARLSMMSYQGVGDASIHTTQLAVTASLLTAGEPVDEVVSIVLDATRAAAGEAGRNWRWDREARAIRRMCDDWIRKHPDVKPRARAQARSMERDEDETISTREGVREGSTGAVVHQLADERKKREKASTRQARAKGKAAAPVVIADGVIEAIRQQGGDLALTEGEAWFYEAGVWQVCAAGEEQWLRTLIQTGCDELGYAGDSKVANGAWKRLMEHPQLHHRRIVWDAGGTVATTNGLLDLKTRALGPYRPEAWCRSKIGQPFQGDAACPIWLAFLTGCFSNLKGAERGAVIGSLQEAFGAALAVKMLMREQRKALFVLGPSRTGKTQISTVAKRLIGDPVASPSIVDVTGAFGMQMLHGARAWIRDDAVSEQDKIDPARFKAIVTGETVEVNRKGRQAINVSFEIPVMLTTNAMPRARDSSDAIYNRSLVIEMTNVVDEDAAEPARVALGLPVDCIVGEEIAAREGPGILNWALDGLDRLRARGRYDPPATMRDAVRRFKDDNNPVAAWMSVAIERDRACKVARNDLRCSFNGWQREEMGAEARAWGGRQFFPQVRSLAPYADMDGEQAHDGERFVTGLRLNKAGLRFWDDHRLEPLGNGTKGYSSQETSVNRDHDTPDRGGGGRTEF